MSIGLNKTFRPTLSFGLKLYFKLQFMRRIVTIRVTTEMRQFMHSDFSLNSCEKNSVVVLTLIDNDIVFQRYAHF